MPQEFGMAADAAAWEQSISSLSDSKFFEIVRLYLGEVETPYNKQRLIQQLAGFVKNETNAQNIICLLDDFDIEVLTALWFIPNATQETLVQFFAGQYTMAELFAELSNLMARLLVYEKSDEYGTKKFLKINPFICDRLSKYISLSNIVRPAQTAQKSIDDVFIISPDFLAAFISFINSKGCACKMDGEVKKNSLAKIKSVFPGHEKAVQLVLIAFINLNLVREGEKTYEIDKKRFELFAALEPQKQYALLCAASCSRFSREGLKKEAQLLLDTLSSVGSDSYTLANLVRIGFLVGNRKSESVKTSSKSRFSRMLEAARNETEILPEQAGSLVERMLDSAVELGLLQKSGKDKNGNVVFACNKIFEATNSSTKSINIDSTFTVSIMPGLSLKELLPLTDFLEIKSYGVVTEYEITRHSVSLAFDKGWNVEKICGELQKYTDYDLPQNLKISISEWYEAYSSAMLYKGYVLKVAKKNIGIVEKNPKISSHIKETLAEGIYLLDIPLEANINDFVEESGLDFMGRVKDSFTDGEKLDFPVLTGGVPLQIGPEMKPAVPEALEGPQTINFHDAGQLLNSLKAELKKLDLTKNQREILENRIRNRLILTKEQLATTSVRLEILEADGMDFGGKLHLFEAGLKENDMMEITLPQFDNENEYFKVIGRTLGITKQTGDAVVRFQVYPTNEITNFVVSRITHLRRLRF
ncbi:MAG: helicase-associated domain-containing protein [Treponema sp.]|nr:helicase-associated domain-containing protein [Treponema sp.]